MNTKIISRTMNVLLRPLTVVFMSIYLLACQPVVRTSIETYSNENLDYAPGSIRVVSQDNNAKPSLEFDYYKDKLQAKLEQSGYRATNSGDAEYVAKLGYSVSRQEKDQPHSRVVIGGHIGGFHPRTSVLIADTLGKDFEYVREVSLSIDRVGTDAGVVQVKATSVGRCEHLNVVYDEMLDAIFSQLDRPNGSIVKVAVKGDIKCP